MLCVKNVCFVHFCVCVWNKTPLSVPGSQSTTSSMSLNFSSCLRHIFVLFATANTIRQHFSQNCLMIPSPHLPSPWRDTEDYRCFSPHVYLVCLHVFWRCQHNTMGSQHVLLCTKSPLQLWFC